MIKELFKTEPNESILKTELTTTVYSDGSLVNKDVLITTTTRVLKIQLEGEK